MSFSIYHCGRCGSLFPSKPGHDEDRVCTVCQQKPGTGEWPAGQEDDAAGGGSPENATEGTEDAGDGVLHRGAKKGRRRNPLTWVVAVWILLMALALWVHARNSALNVAEKKRVAIEDARRKERSAVLAAALPQCHKSLLGFLNAGTPEARARFVMDPASTAAKMAGFRGEVRRVDPARLSRTGQELLWLDGEWAVRTRWQDGGDGGVFDAVFRQESGAWLLDWEHFARFSTHPWDSFIAGEGPDEGEFRVFAQLVPETDETRWKVRHLRFVLLPPESDGNPNVPDGLPVFSVNRLSEDGLLLEAAFAAKAQGGGPFGGVMRPLEPEGMVCVRALVERSDFGGVVKFEIGKIIACHWITSDAPGFDLGKLKDKAFGVN